MSINCSMVTVYHAIIANLCSFELCAIGTDGTEVINQSDSSDSSQLCLSDEAVLKLATIGLQVSL